MTLHSNRCYCHDAFPKIQPLLVFPSPLLPPAETMTFLLATSVIHTGADYYQIVLQPSKGRISGCEKGQELCPSHVSATQERSQHLPSSSRPWGSTSQGCPPLITWFLSGGEKVLCPTELWRGTEHFVCSEGWFSASPCLWFTALCSHSTLRTGVLGRTLNILMTFYRLSVSCCADHGKAEVAVLLPSPQECCLQLTHTPDLHSDFLLFFVLPNDQVPAFSPIQALSLLLYKLLLKPLQRCIWNLSCIWGRWRDWDRMVNRQV